MENPENSPSRKSASRKRKRGRPALPPEERRVYQVMLQFTSAERAWVDAQAEDRGLEPSVWARRRVLRGYKRAKT